MQSLGIDVKLLIAQVINFALFLIIFHRFISKPFLRFLDKEKKKEEEIKKAHEKALKLEEDLAKKEQLLQQTLKKEREKVIEKAKKDAELVKEQILEEARGQAKKILEKTQKQIEQEREIVYSQAKEKINELSFYLINTALRDILTDDLRKKITQQILKNSPKNINFNEN